jgi:septin family protein
MAISTATKTTFINTLVNSLTDDESTQEQIDGITNFATIISDAIEVFVKDGEVTVDHNLTGTQTVNVE